jgi:hypothetical protein
MLTPPSQEKEEYLWKKVNVHAVAKPLVNMCATPNTSDPKNMYYIYVCEKVSSFPVLNHSPLAAAPLMIGPAGGGGSDGRH